jgi:hypothetical protein
MLFGGQTLAHHWRHTKKVMGDTWHHAVKFGQGLDQGMQVGKRLLASVAPLLDQFGGGHHMKPIMQGISAYDHGKADVMFGYNNVASHLSRIKRQVPEIGL